MKNLFLSITLLSVVLMSCSKTNVSSLSNFNQTETINSELNLITAKQNFAKLLSKAVYEDSELRTFLKNEAIKQFDRDYDVFYPYVKNKIASNGKTFRQVLLSYCSKESELLDIEKALPKLNILIPDLTLYSNFSADTWDVNDKDLVVSYQADGEDKPLYIDGNTVDVIKKGEVPATAILVVKENERMKSVSAMRVGANGVDCQYDFADKAYDANEFKEESKMRGDHYDIYFQNEEINNSISTSYLDESLIKAYNENLDKSCHRDYIYYSMSKDNTNNGRLNHNIREELLKFTIKPIAYDGLNAQDDKNPKLQETSRKTYALTNEEVLDRVWTDGAYEFVFDVFTVHKTSGGDKVDHQSLHCPVRAKDLFGFSSMYVHRTNRTLIRRSKYTYYPDSKRLVSKWVYPAKYVVGSSLLLKKWDIYSDATTIRIIATEYNPTRSIENTETFKYTHSQETSFSHEDKDSNTKHTFTHKDETSKTSSIKINYTITSKVLGTLDINYTDNVILGKDTNHSGNNYNVMLYNNGVVTAAILPKNLNK